MAYDTWEYDNAREIFSHPSPNLYMMHATLLFESKIEGISYEHSHTSCVPVSCDYCDSFDHNVDTCPLFGIPHRLEALVAFNKEIYLQSLLKTDGRSCEDFDIRSETPIPLARDCYDDTPSKDLGVSSDPLLPFASPLQTSTPLDTFEDVSVIPDRSFPLAPVGEFEDGDEFETDASFVDQCGILVESKDTFYKEYSLGECSDVEFSEVSPHMEHDDPISDESLPDLAPAHPILSFSSPLPLIFLL